MFLGENTGARACATKNSQAHRGLSFLSSLQSPVSCLIFLLQRQLQFKIREPLRPIAAAEREERLDGSEATMRRVSGAKSFVILRNVQPAPLPPEFAVDDVRFRVVHHLSATAGLVVQIGR